MRRVLIVLTACFCWMGSVRVAIAVDNELTPEEAKAGWQLLFDGKSLDGWRTPSGRPSAVGVEDCCINPHRSGDDMLIHAEEHDDFQLAVDFKISPKCNSGIFVRTFPLQPRPGKDVGFNGIEIAIDDTTTAGYHDTGAIYDLVRPKKNAMRPAGEWNQALITCDKNRISVEINGELVNEMNLDEWTAPNRRPDGSEHKFDIAYRDHPRHGYLGFQDHGSPVWYKNVKLRPLNQKVENQK